MYPASEEAGFIAPPTPSPFSINNSVLSRIEAGKRDVEDYLLSKIADVLEVSTDYLLGHTDDPTLYQKSGCVNRFDDVEDNLEEEIKRILDDPETEIFFKDYLSVPEEKKKQLRDFLRFLLEEEKRKEGE